MTLAAVAAAASADSVPRAPALLGSLMRFQDVPINSSGPGKVVARQHVEDNAKSTKLLSQAYGGAAATVQDYADNGLLNMALLLLVRAPSPRPFVPYQDAKFLGLATPPQQVLRYGDVWCEILYSPPTVAGRKPAPSSVNVVGCRKSNPKLTVWIQDVSGGLLHDPAAVAALVDQAWNDVA
jgi:hypothetical protein